MEVNALMGRFCSQTHSQRVSGWWKDTGVDANGRPGADFLKQQ